MRIDAEPRISRLSQGRWNGTCTLTAVRIILVSFSITRPILLSITNLSFVPKDLKAAMVAEVFRWLSHLFGMC